MGQIKGKKQHNMTCNVLGHLMPGTTSKCLGIDSTRVGGINIIPLKRSSLNILLEIIQNVNSIIKAKQESCNAVKLLI